MPRPSQQRSWAPASWGAQRGWLDDARRAARLFGAAAPLALAIVLALSGSAVANTKKKPPAGAPLCARLPVGPIASYLKLGPLARQHPLHLPPQYCSYGAKPTPGHYPPALLIAVLPGSAANFEKAEQYSEVSAGIAGLTLSRTSVIHSGPAFFTTFVQQSTQLCLAEKELAQQTGKPLEGPVCSTLDGDIVAAWDTHGKGLLRGSIISVSAQADISAGLTLSRVLGVTEELMTGRIV
jgi:hypothetical protein